MSRLARVAALSAFALTTTASPAVAAPPLSRDPVAVVYARDHALNAGATDDDLQARTAKLAGSAWGFFRGTSPLFYRDLG